LGHSCLLLPFLAWVLSPLSWTSKLHDCTIYTFMM
jgi:hypothetical protein